MHIVPDSDDKVEVVKKMLNQSEHAASLLWEMCYNVTEFNSPVSLGMHLPRNVNTNLRDIMLARVETLGHCDKYPRTYDWQQLLQTLNDNEELLWIVTKKHGEKKFTAYVGLKFNTEDIGSLNQLHVRQKQFQVFSDNFSRRRFPGSLIERVPQGISLKDLLQQLSHSGSKFAVVGMPSIKALDPEKILEDRDEEKRSYASLNDILEPFVNIDSGFTIVFSVSPCANSDIRLSFQRKFELRNLLKPFLEQELNHTEGESWGDGINITPEIETTNNSSTQKKHIIACLARGVKGTSEKAHKNSWLRADETVSKSKTPAHKARTHHNDWNRSNSQTIHVSRSDLVFLDSILEQSIKHLQQTLGGNGFHASAVVYAEDENIGMNVARLIRATLSGSQNYLRPMQIFPLENEEFFQFDYNCTMAELLQLNGFNLEVLNSERASVSLPVPDSDIPGGMDLKKSVFYSKPEESKMQIEEGTVSDGQLRKYKDDGVLLGRVAYYENQLGYKDAVEYNYKIPHNDIFSHAFISGAPGGGKSKRTAFILNHLPSDMRLIVLETAKKEYGDILHREGKSLVRYTLGNSQIRPLRINPFFFEPGTSLKQHISVLADALTELLPVEALIGPKMREAVERCYVRCCWDVETSNYYGPSPYPTYPDMLMFNSEIKKVCETFVEYGAEVRGNYTGALKNRASIFLDEIYQDIFAIDGNKTIDQLFPHNADVVIEMEDMPPSEMNMPAFILTLLMHRLRAYRFLQNEIDERRGRQHKSRKFIIAIEEAHNVLSREIEASPGSGQQTGKGRALLSLIKKTLAEGRGIGMGLIIVDQSAHAIAPSVLANTNMKIIFRQKDGEEVETLGKAIGLSEQDRQDLQYLGTGECAISTVDNPKPFKLAKLKDWEIEELMNVSRRDEVVVYEDPRTPPYSIGRRVLDQWCSDGLHSYREAQELANKLYELCGSRYAAIRYIIGKYLLDKCLDNAMLYTVLNDLLNSNTLQWKKQMDCIADVLNKITDGKEADLFLECVGDLRMNCQAQQKYSRSSYNFCKLPMDIKNASHDVLRILINDTDDADETHKMELQSLFNDLQGSMADPLKFDGWRAKFWKINGNLRIFEHLVYRKKQEEAVEKILAEMSSIVDK